MKIKNLHIYFFYLFLFSIPFQTRKVFLTEYSFYSGAFTEYTTFFLYLSDIFLILALFFWLILNKKLIKRINFTEINIKGTSEKSKSCHSRGGGNPEFNSKYNILRYNFGSFLKFSKTKNNQIWKYFLLFVFVLGMNLILKRDYFEISLFQFLKFIEVFLLLIFVYFNLKRKKILFNSLLILSISGFFQGIIAILQFINQKSVFYNSPFVQKLIGESLIDSNISGVANFVFEGQKIVRSYGTFPHPNILGGFLIFTIFITIFLYLESKSGYLSSRILSFRLNRQDNNTNRHKSQGVFYVYFWVVLIFVQISALFLTFSRVSWIGAILAVILLCFFCLFNKIVSRETILLRQVNFFRKILNISYNYKELLIAVILFLLVIISNFFLIQARFNGDMFSNSNLPNNSAISDRLFYNNVSRETISNNFLFGSGIGTSIFQINNYLKNNDIEQEIEPWQYQPAHNIYFLIASEVGIIGLLFFLLLFIVYVISNSIKIVSRETISNNKLSPYLLVILMTFLFIGVFDHYFWTLQQGQLIFWLVLALIMVISKNTRK